MTHEIPLPLSEDERNQALAYVLGWLSADEQIAYRKRLADRPEGYDYVRDMQEVLGLIGSLAPEKEPPPGLKAKLFERLDRGLDMASSANPPEAMKDALAGRVIPQWCLDMAWQETSLPGIRWRILFEDQAACKRGVLLNIAPGGQYPAHRHSGDEYFFLIEGDLVVDEYGGDGQLKMAAGDFQRSPAGSVHGRLCSPSGCFALVISSTKDEVLEELTPDRK